MNDTPSPAQAQSRFPRDRNSLRLLSATMILAGGMALGGYLLGDGLPRAKEAERSVTVRGLAERDVTADLATWTISYSDTRTDLGAAQAKVAADRRALEQFFADLGFPADALQPIGANVSSYTDSETGITRYTVRERLALRTTDIARAQQAVARQFELVQQGVLVEEGSAMAYTFTGLNAIKPEMVAEATRDARAAAEQFAEDSGAAVSGIKQATQGYFTITARDGDSDGGWGVSDTPYKKVRVVTTISFGLG